MPVGAGYRINPIIANIFNCNGSLLKNRCEKLY